MVTVSLKKKDEFNLNAISHQVWSVNIMIIDIMSKLISQNVQVRSKGIIYFVIYSEWLSHWSHLFIQNWLQELKKLMSSNASWPILVLTDYIGDEEFGGAHVLTKFDLLKKDGGFDGSRTGFWFSLYGTTKRGKRAWCGYKKGDPLPLFLDISFPGSCNGEEVTIMWVHF